MKQIETQLIVKDPLHNSHLSHNLWQLYQGGLLLDVSILSSDGIKFRAHWVILCGASEVFRSVIGSININTQAVLVEIPSDILGLIIEYLYTGEIKVTSLNYLKLIDVAKAQKLHRLAELIEQQFVSFVKKHPDVDTVMKVEPADIEELNKQTDNQDSSKQLKEMWEPECQSMIVKIEKGESEDGSSIAKKAVVVNKGLVLRKVDANNLKTLKAGIKAGTIQPIIVKRSDSELRTVLTRPNSDLKTLKAGIEAGMIQPIAVKRPERELNTVVTRPKVEIRQARLSSKPNILRRNTSSNANSLSETSLISGSKKQIYMPAHIGFQEKEASKKGQTQRFVNAGFEEKESLPTNSGAQGQMTSILFNSLSEEEHLWSDTKTGSKESPVLRSFPAMTASKGKQISKLAQVNCIEKKGTLYTKSNSKDTESSFASNSQQEKDPYRHLTAGCKDTLIRDDKHCPTLGNVVEMNLSSSGIVMTGTSHTDVEETSENTLDEACYESMIEIDRAVEDCVPFVVKSESLDEEFALPLENVCDERLKYFYKRPAMKTALHLVRWYRRKFYPNLIQKEKKKKKKLLWCTTCRKQFRTKAALREHTEFGSCKLMKKRKESARIISNSWERRRAYRLRRKDKTQSKCESEPCPSNSQNVDKQSRRRGISRKTDNLDGLSGSQNIVNKKQKQTSSLRESEDLDCISESEDIVEKQRYKGRLSITDILLKCPSDSQYIVERNEKEIGQQTEDIDCSSDSQDLVEREIGIQKDDLDCPQVSHKIVRNERRKTYETEEAESTAPPTDLRRFEFVHCPECEEMFTTADMLRQHLTIVHSYTDEQVEKHMSSRFQCVEEACWYQGKDSKHLREHMARTHPYVLYECPQCYRHFSLKDTLQQHIKLTHNSAMQEKYLFSCDVCKERFMSVIEKEGHEKMEHGVDHPIEVHECSMDGCDMRTWSEKLLNQHMVSCHTATFPFICSYCYRPYWSNIGLKKHVQETHEDQRFLCQVCGVSFSTKQAMSQHTRTQHYQEGQITCQLCSTFHTFSKRSLANHMYYKHRIKASFDPRPILHCDKCSSYSSMSATSMKRHMNSVHSNVRKFSCEVCSKSFKSNRELTLHKQVHAIAKSNFCPECNFSSRCQGTLDKHIKTQHWFKGYKPYLCVYCDFGANVMAKVRYHERKVHQGHEVIVQTDHGVKEQMKIIMLQKKKEKKGNNE